MNIFRLFLGFSLIASHSVQAFSRHCKSKRAKTAAEQIASLNPQTDFNLIDLDLFSSGTFTSGYEYEVEPAYTKGLYARKDTWQIEAKGVAERSVEMEQEWDLNLSAGPQYKTQATFTRFMKDPCEAMLAVPYAPNRIPLKSTIALGPHFHVGDYFLFRSSSGFVMSGEMVGLLGTPLWGMTLGGNYAMEGFYQLHIVRLDDQHIRFKIVGHRGRSFRASLGIGYKEKFEVFEIKALNKQLERFVNTKPVSLYANKGNSRVFMVDYVLDLQDENVSQAFDQVLKKIKNFKSLHPTAPFREQTDLENNFLLDLTPLEELFRSDYANNTVKRIRRNLRTTSEQDAYVMGLDAGNKVFGFKLNGGSATSLMNITNPGDVVERYLLRTWETSWESRFLYSYKKNRSDDSLSTLFSADNNFRDLFPLNVVRQLSQRKTRLSYKDFRKLKLKIKKALPQIVYNQIPFGDWRQGQGENYFNFGLRYELLMTPESVMTAPELSAEEIKTRFRAYIADKNLGPQDFFRAAGKDPSYDTAENEFNSSLESLSLRFSRALDRSIPIEKKLEEITKLKSNILFAESGLGFIMSLHPFHMKELFHLDLDISSNEANIDFSYGLSQNTDLLKKILSIKAALDDDAFDLLKEAESLSFKEER
jgi:hypothetical protein